MEYEEIKKLIGDMGDSKLTYLDIEFPDGIKISMKKEQMQEKKQVKVMEQEKVIENLSENIAEGTKNNKLEEGTHIISPMVGTFYASPSPNAEAFVTAGTVVKKGDVLCIIEAMKLMNEIEAEQDGTIVEVLVKDGEMVDYAKPLFKIK